MGDLIHGGDIYTQREKGRGEGLLDFSANINPLGIPNRVLQAVISGLSDAVHYPDPLCRELIGKLAQAEGVDRDFFICGNGAADLIFRLVVAKMPYKAVVLAPTFAEYEAALESVGCVVRRHYLREETEFCLGEDLLFELNESVDLLFLCNPNNPTGQIIDPHLLKAVLKRCKEKEILLVLDECFCDFVETVGEFSLKNMVDVSHNLFILRAFTKNYGIPGLRLGYGICSDENLLDVMRSTGQPWSVSLPAQIAGIQALEEKEYLEEARALVFSERKRMAAALTNLGLKVYPPGANYIFFKLAEGYHAETFEDRLLEKGILVRSCGNYAGLTKEFFRVAVKRPEENDRLIVALKAIRS